MLLSASDRERLRDELAARLEREVLVRLRVDDTPPSARAIAIMDELLALTPRIATRKEVVKGDQDRAPSLILEGAARGVLRFTGLPTGYEFPTLIDALVAVSTGRTPLSSESTSLLAALERDLSLRIFTTPT